MRTSLPITTAAALTPRWGHESRSHPGPKLRPAHIDTSVPLCAASNRQPSSAGYITNTDWRGCVTCDVAMADHNLLKWDSEWVIDGIVRDSGALCGSQVRSEPAVSNLAPGVLLVSLRDVAAGEELTVNYDLSRESGPDVCRCGAAECRGFMNPCVWRPVAFDAALRTATS